MSTTRAARRAGPGLALVLGLLVPLLTAAPAAAGDGGSTRVVTFESAAEARRAVEQLEGAAAAVTPRAIVADLDDRTAHELVEDREVVAVEDDHLFHAAELDTVADDPCIAGCDGLDSWYLDEIGVTDAWSRTHGAGVVVAVVDTGVDATHPDLAGKLVAPEIDVLGGDDRGTAHGTAVAGLALAAADNGTGIAGVARDARLLSVRVLDAEGSGPLSTIAAGIVAAADAGADVINLSLTGSHSAALADAVAHAVDRGAIVVAAGGNDGGSSPRYPAALPGVIAVGATDRTAAMAGFSNRGPWIDVYAPGVGADVGLPTTSTTGGVVEFTGTSAATPIVAGVAALARAHTPGLDSPAAEELLRSTAAGLAGLPVVDAAAATAAPGLFPDEANSPLGEVDSVVPAPGGFAIRGWTVDPNTRDAIGVHVYATGKGALATAHADVPRDDLPGPIAADHGDHHGFEQAFRAGSGPYELCAFGIDAGAGSNAKLGCVTAERPSGATGHLDEARRLDAATVRLRGWALDREQAGPTQVHVYVDGGERRSFTADGSRGDIARAYPGWGAAHGFTVDVAARPGERACVYAISPAGNNLVGCAAA